MKQPRRRQQPRRAVPPQRSNLQPSNHTKAESHLVSVLKGEANQPRTGKKKKTMSQRQQQIVDDCAKGMEKILCDMLLSQGMKEGGESASSHAMGKVLRSGVTMDRGARFSARLCRMPEARRVPFAHHSSTFCARRARASAPPSSPITIWRRTTSSAAPRRPCTPIFRWRGCQTACCRSRTRCQGL